MATYAARAKLRANRGYLVAVGSDPEQLPVYAAGQEGGPLVPLTLRWPAAIWRMAPEMTEELQTAKQSSMAKVEKRWRKVPDPLTVEQQEPARR